MKQLNPRSSPVVAGLARFFPVGALIVVVVGTCFFITRQELALEEAPSDELRSVGTNALPVGRAPPEPPPSASAAPLWPGGHATFEQWARADPRGALAWWRTLPDGGAKEDLAAVVAFELVARDARSALAEINSAAPDTLTLHIIAAWTQLDPHAAAAWAETLPEGVLRERAVASVVTVWCYNDAPATAQWIATFPEGRVRAEGLARAVTQWSSADFENAGRWLTALPSSPSRDRAIEAHLAVLKVEGIAGAAQWLKTVPASEHTFVLIEEIAREWLASDERKARAWLEQTELPVERRQRLIEQTPRR